MRNSICRGCGASIVWIGLQSGKSMPCDASPVYYKEHKNGKDKIVTPNGIVITCDIVENPNKADGVGYKSHFATCTKSDSFRKKG